jgi:hypothetical protein
MRTLLFLILAFQSALAQLDFKISGPQEIESTGELLTADDITAQSYQLNWTGSEGAWEIDIGIAWNTYDIDYSPVLFGTAESLAESTVLANLSVTRQWNPEWSGTLRARAYEGFSDYRSIWISEFYRQFFGAFDSYEGPDPHGRSFGAATRWDYLPGSGSAVFTVDFGRDVIAPGWSFDGVTGQPEAGRETLDTVSGGLRVDQALSGWLKTGVAFTARQTSDRSARYGARNTWAATSGAFGFRLDGGYTTESPSFDALFGSALVEWNFMARWTAHIGCRFYQDSGEIESSGFDALAPELDSSEIFTGLVWSRGDLVISGSLGFLSTDYESLSEDNEFFGNLYQDRDWLTFRLAASLRF